MSRDYSSLAALLELTIAVFDIPPEDALQLVFRRGEKSGWHVSSPGGIDRRAVSPASAQGDSLEEALSALERKLTTLAEREASYFDAHAEKCAARAHYLFRLAGGK
jgi:hypothetical protein